MAEVAMELDRTPETLELVLSMSDPDVVAYLHRLDDDARCERAEVALRIGVMALQRAAGFVDAEVLRRQSDRLLHDVQSALNAHSSQVSVDVGKALSAYLDPATGSLPQRLELLTRADGDLAKILDQHVGSDNSSIARTLAKHFGDTSPVFRMLDPTQKDGLVGSLEQVLQQSLQDQRQRILREFSLDDDQSALARLVKTVTDQQGELKKGFRDNVDELKRELSLDDEDSALSGLVRRVDRAQRGIVEQFSLDSDTSALSRIKKELATSIEALGATQLEFQQQVLEMLARLQERKKVEATGTQHGLVFEEALLSWLSRSAERQGDLFEATGASVGLIKNCKKGDAVVTLGPDKVGKGNAVVFEAKEDRSYNDKKAMDEMSEARTNRKAAVGVFVMSRKHAYFDVPLRRVGQDLFVVWDADDASTDVFLAAAYAASTAIAASASSSEVDVEVDMDAIDKSINEVVKQAERMDGIRKRCDSIRSAAEFISEEARKANDALLRECRRLGDQTVGMRRHLGR